MGKGLFPICIVVVVLIVLLGVLVPGCTGVTAGTIEVKATLDGAPWTGAVQYTLSGPGSPPTGTTSVPKSFTVAPGGWNCTYVSGGPPAAYFVNITPSRTQSVSEDETITFTLNFASFAAAPLDASIEFVSWTINGTQVPPSTYFVGPNTIIDVGYAVHVDGAPGAVVTVNETSWLLIHYVSGVEDVVWLDVVNAPGAVSMSPPATKLHQMTIVDEEYAEPGTSIPLSKGVPVYLGVETVWELVICNNYTNSINWLLHMPLNGAEVLFDLQTVGGNFTVTAWSQVDLVGDVNPANNSTGWSPEQEIQDP